MTSRHSSNDVRIFYKECSSLAGAGYDVYFVAPGTSREESGVHIVGVGEVPSRRVIRMTTFAHKVYEKALAIDADIYHLHDPELLPYGMKLKRHGKKVIFDSHENTLNQMIDKAWIPSYFRPLVSVAYRSYATSVFNKYDALVSVTPDVVDDLKTKNPNTYLVTNYPILSDKSQPNPEPSQAFTLCFTGGIEKQWNHVNILRALSQVEGARYVLCGRAEKEYLDALSAEEGWEKADFVGYVSHDRSVQIQRSANVGMALLLPSNNTCHAIGSLGNTKIFEYMMAGIPVICTGFVLWKEILEKYKFGICVDPEDVDAIADAIIYLRDHPEEAREMGENGRRAVAEEFNWGTQVGTLLELYKNILQEV